MYCYYKIIEVFYYLILCNLGEVETRKEEENGTLITFCQFCASYELFSILIGYKACCNGVPLLETNVCCTRIRQQ